MKATHLGTAEKIFQNEFFTTRSYASELKIETVFVIYDFSSRKKIVKYVLK